MKLVDVKKLMISSLSTDANSEDIMKKLEEAGVKYSFDEDFRDKVLLRIY